MATTVIIPSDTPASVFDPIKALSTLDQQAIVRPNNPPPGIAGFVFNITGDENIELRSDIPDSYVEKNTAIQDQIALPPEEYTVSGLQAELSDARATQPTVASITDALPVNEQLLPTFTAQALQTLVAQAATTVRASRAITDNQSLYGYFKNNGGLPPNTTKQTEAFLYFYQLWKGRQLCSVETAWGFFTDMAIQSLRMEQSEETKFKSELTITFKKIRFAQDITIRTGKLAGRSANQDAPITQNGNVGKKPGDNASLLARIIGGILPFRTP